MNTSASMTLDIQQQKAIQQGQPVPIVVDGTECVLLRKDVFERVKQVIGDDALDADTLYELLEATADDAQDPGLHLYQQYKQ